MEMEAVSYLAGVMISTSTEGFPAMEHFYGTLFAGNLHSRRPGFVNFAWGNQRLTVSVHSEVSGRSNQPARVMVNFAVGDVDQMASDLAKLGISIVRRPENEAWGGRICTAQDPDGNLIQFLQLGIRADQAG